MFFQTRNLYHLRVNKHSVLPLYLYLDESHVEWMSRNILKEIIADLKPLIGPKLVKESHIGASGLSATVMKKAGQSVVEVHRGEPPDNYQFAYFLKPTDSYDLIIKTRDFVAVTTAPDSLRLSEEKSPTPEPVIKKSAKRNQRQRKRATKSTSRSKASSAAKKRKRVEESDEEDAEMSDAWSDLDKDLEEGSQASDDSQIEFVPSSSAPTRRSTRNKNAHQVEAVDVDMHEEVQPQGRETPIAVKSEPDDTSALANLIPISADEEPTPGPQSPNPKPPSEQLVVEEEEEKPKQELQLTYAGHIVPSRCICVIAEPWPALPTPAQLASQATKSQPKSLKSSAQTNARPLFRPDSDDEGSDKETPALQRSPSPPFDSDDEEGRLRMFSQMINNVGERRSGIAARGAMDEFEDDALYGDADEDGRGV